MYRKARVCIRAQVERDCASRGQSHSSANLFFWLCVCRTQNSKGNILLQTVAAAVPSKRALRLINGSKPCAKPRRRATELGANCFSLSVPRQALVNPLL
eukprot:872344-Amphidinium_carterae.2